MRGTLTLLLLLAVFSAASAADPPPLEPFFGTWKVDYQRSWDRAMASPEFGENDSLAVTQYMTTMSDIMEMSIDAYNLTYTRGKQSRQVPYEVRAQSADSVKVDIDVEGLEYSLTFAWAEKGYMFIESTASARPDFFIYKRVSLETADPLPPLPGTPGAP